MGCLCGDWGHQGRVPEGGVTSWDGASGAVAVQDAVQRGDPLPAQKGPSLHRKAQSCTAIPWTASPQNALHCAGAHTNPGTISGAPGAPSPGYAQCVWRTRCRSQGEARQILTTTEAPGASGFDPVVPPEEVPRQGARCGERTPPRRTPQSPSEPPSPVRFTENSLVQGTLENRGPWFRVVTFSFVSHS